MLWGEINVDFRSVKHIADHTWRVDEVDNTSLTHMGRGDAYGAAPQTLRIGIERRLVVQHAHLVERPERDARIPRASTQEE